MFDIVVDAVMIHLNYGCYCLTHVRSTVLRAIGKVVGVIGTAAAPSARRTVISWAKDFLLFDTYTHARIILRRSTLHITLNSLYICILQRPFQV